jgi:hypothetical protein
MNRISIQTLLMGFLAFLVGLAALAFVLLRPPVASRIVRSVQIQIPEVKTVVGDGREPIVEFGVIGSLDQAKEFLDKDVLYAVEFRRTAVMPDGVIHVSVPVVITRNSIGRIVHVEAPGAVIVRIRYDAESHENRDFVFALPPASELAVKTQLSEESLSAPH